jgi:tetratricopeptide (TPR) repeat protein
MSSSSSSLQQLREQALRHHQSGNLAEAEKLYSQLIAAEPGGFSPLYLLGILRAQQGRHSEALELIGTALKINPDIAEAQRNYGNILNTAARFDDALAAFDRALALEPGNAAAWNGRGSVLHAQDRLEDALDGYDRALAIRPDLAEALSNRANVLLELRRFEEAVAAYDRLAVVRPQSPDAFYWRGNALRELKRPAEALASYDRASALRPDFAAALNNRGGVLRLLNRGDEALACFERLTVLDPGNAEHWNNRGIVLQALGRMDEALASYDRALAAAPDSPVVLNNRGKALLECDRVADAMTVFARSAQLAYGAATPDPAAPPHMQKHDLEQADYLGSALDGRLRISGGARLSGAAINPANSQSVTRQWQSMRPQIVVIDDLLTPEALAELRRFCLESTIWRKAYDNGYLGAIPEFGFATPLLAQIADEFRSAFPAIFKSHPLRYLWAFKYDSDMTGISVHADEAAVNVNFWITPDEANRDPQSGGLRIWDVSAPLDWDFAKFNGDLAATRAFLERSGATATTVPYRANRAVVFDSDLFHETDRIAFKDGYANRRINVTLLYGRREQS